MLIKPFILGRVARSLISDNPNMELVTYTAGEENAAGEREGVTPIYTAYSALITSATSKLGKERWGEVPLGSKQALMATDVYPDAESVFKEGVHIRYKQALYEIKKTKVPDLNGETPFFRFMMEEIRGNGHA